MSGYRIDRGDVLRRRLLITVLLTSLTGAAFLMLHTIATADPRHDAAKVRIDRTNPRAGTVQPAIAGIQPSWLVLAINLVVTGVFAVSCHRWTGRCAPTPREADAAARGAGGIGYGR